MSKTLVVAVCALALLSAGPVAAQDVRAVIRAASEEMGVTGFDRLTYSGSAVIGNFGQSRTISFGLASTQIRGYARTIDFTIPASRATGDAFPPARDGDDQSEPYEYDEMVTPVFTGWAHQMQIWVTPWGFLRGAAAATAPTMRMRTIDDVPYKVVTWSPAQRAPSGAPYRVVGYISPENVVDRVETWVEHPLLGDLHVEYFYSGYRELHSVMMPTRIAERRVGMETFVVEIREAESDPPDVEEMLALPPVDEQRRLAAGPPPLPPPSSERVAEGVYRLTGDYQSLAVEFKDFIVVLEAPHSEARGLAVLAEVKRLFPSKRIRYVVNTHAHFDHAEGLPPFVAEGVTIITDDTGRYFLEQALSADRTLGVDTLAKSRRKPRVEGVLDKREITDGTRTLELHHVPKLEHSDGMLVAYLRKERILFSADLNVTRPDESRSANAAAFRMLGERVQLELDQHVQVHERRGRRSQ